MNRKERRGAKKRGQAGGGPETAAMFAQALRNHQLGQWLEAEAQCRTILERDPKHLGSLHLLGALAQGRGSHEQAAALFRDAARLKPDMVVFHYGLGRSLAELGRIDEAVQAVERARALDAGGSAARQPTFAPDYAATYLNFGNLCMERGRLDEAGKLYERALALKPDFADAHSNLGALLLSRGKVAEASARYVRALELAPDLVDIFANVSSTLYRLDPALEQAVARAGRAWPKLLPEQELLGEGGLAAIAGDAVLRFVLEAITVRDIELERTLTALRRAMLDRAAAAAAAGHGDPDVLRLCCALARQCFINEYVFAVAPDELERAASLKQSLIDALASGGEIPALWPAALACYFPLDTLPGTQALLERAWPDPVAALLTQQIAEVEQQRRDRDGIPRLTGIAAGTSEQVREQYEENPYPRWVVAPARRKPLTLDDHLRQRFPWASFRPLGERGGADILVAGCGTGQNSIALAQSVLGGRVLAIDLSLSSLSYALHKTRELDLANIEHAQADILQLRSLGRTFDLIDASGVLHHLADPMEGWRILLSLLRPGGFMRVGLYSELARRDVVAAQRLVAERGYRPTRDDIRRCRHELMDTPLRGIVKFHDFFSTSECRDLLFHVQEHRHTIAQIAEFLRAQNLSFIGFELDATFQQAYRLRYPRDPSMTDLDSWHAFEVAQLDAFAAMYQFWIQRG